MGQLLQDKDGARGELYRPEPLVVSLPSSYNSLEFRFNSSTAFIRSYPSAFKEVQQIKNCVHTIVCQLLVQNSGVNVNGQSPVLNGLPTAPSIPPVIPPRKRQAPMSTQPECPVALRPLSTCPIPSSFMPQWPWLFPPVVRPPSPTLPAPSLESLAPVAEHTDQGKWSNPSSVESNGLKTDSSTGESANIDIVGMDGSESSTSSTSTQVRSLIG
uniref:Protein SMG7 n=1 Tax=Heterorhabditis bacteriophora TaxID=37862 RepID=A0A1I7WWX5_HETBA